MTVVKRTNRCATVAFGCDRSTRARRTNERTNERTTRMKMNLDWERLSTRGSAVEKTWDDDETSARGVKVKRLTMCSRGVVG